MSRHGDLRLRRPPKKRAADVPAAAESTDEYHGEDVFSVRELEPRVLEVRHYANADAGRACCRLRVDVSDADVAAKEAWEAIHHHGWTSALQRSYLFVERRHGRSTA